MTLNLKLNSSLIILVGSCGYRYIFTRFSFIYEVRDISRNKHSRSQQFDLNSTIFKIESRGSEFMKDFKGVTRKSQVYSHESLNWLWLRLKPTKTRAI